MKIKLSRLETMASRPGDHVEGTEPGSPKKQTAMFPNACKTQRGRSAVKLEKLPRGPLSFNFLGKFILHKNEQAIEVKPHT